MNSKWSAYFKDFKIPYGFYSPEEYKSWLLQSGFIAKRVELIPKDMVHKNKNDLAAWVLTTWLPYTQRIPAEIQDNYIGEIVDEYLGIFSPNQDGYIYVQMFRLEVEAEKNSLSQRQEEAKVVHVQLSETVSCPEIFRKSEVLKWLQELVF